MVQALNTAQTPTVRALQIPALVAAGYRVIAPDLRGFGQTDKPQDPRDYGLKQLVADVIGILFTRLQAPTVALSAIVAHDYGTALGTTMAAMSGAPPPPPPRRIATNTQRTRSIPISLHPPLQATTPLKV